MAAKRLTSIADTPHHALLNYIYDYTESTDVTPKSWAALYSVAVVAHGTIDPDHFRSNRHQRFANDPLGVFAGDVQSILMQMFLAQDEDFRAAAVCELAASPFWQPRQRALWSIRDLLGKGYVRREELDLSELVHDPDPVVQETCRDILSEENTSFYADDRRASEAFRLLVGAEAFRRPAPPTQA